MDDTMMPVCYVRVWILCKDFSGIYDPCRDELSSLAGADIFQRLPGSQTNKRHKAVQWPVLAVTLVLSKNIRAGHSSRCEDEHCCILNLQETGS